MSASHLFGIHDWSESWASLIRDAGKTAWTVISESIGDDPTDKSGVNYSHLAQYGVTPIVRLNFSHHGYGTIPLSNRYDLFAQRCANFVSTSQGCRHWIIGNEPNLKGERVAGVPITPKQYADCFRRCRHAIKQRGAQHHVIVAAVAPYNDDTGPWLDYWREMLIAIAGDSGADGLALHFYSRGADPTSIRSDTKMDAPFGHLYNGFRAYRDLMAMVPDDLRHLLAYATETNQLQPWADNNSGWVQAAYAEIDAWNKSGGQAIHCLCLYRWQKHDQWHIEGKQGVIDDFRAAIAKGYTSPQPSAQSQPQQETHLPIVSTGTQAQPTLSPRKIDPRATARGVTIEMPQVAPGQAYWRVKRLYTPNEEESDMLGPDRHILANVLQGGKRLVDIPLLVTWGSGGSNERATIRTKKNDAFEFSSDHALTPGDFTIEVSDGQPSEKVVGIKMGANRADGTFNPNAHASTLVDFELTTMPTAPQPVTPPTKPAIGYVIATAGLRMRNIPPDGSTVTIVPFAKQVQIVGVGGGTVGTEDWLRVQYGEHEGWVHGAYVSLEEPEPLPAPVEPTPTPMPTGIIEPRVAQAILKIESNNQAFGKEGLIIRFEAHVFKQYLKNDDLWARHFRVDKAKPWTNQEWRQNENDAWQLIHTNDQTKEYRVLMFAGSFNREAALKATSMGAPQIMGLNHARIGYPTADAMFKAFGKAEMQIIGFINFFLSDPALMDAMRRKDWREIAAKYNGASNIDVYAPLLEKAYRELGG